MDQIVRWFMDIATLAGLINAPQVQIDGATYVLLVVVTREPRL
jgi:hypothetical protein